MSARRSSTACVEALRDGGERRLPRFALRGLEQRIDEVERVLDGRRRVVGDERGLERGLQLVRDERREVLERLVALGELDRRSRQALFGRAAPDDRRERDQRRLDLRVETAAVENEHTGSSRAAGCGATASDPDRQRRARARRRRPWPTTRPSRRRSRGEPVRPTGAMPDARSSAVASARTMSCSRRPRRVTPLVRRLTWRTGSSMTFATRHDMATGDAASSRSSGRPVRNSIPRAAACAKGWWNTSSARSSFVEDELEVVVVCSVVDSDGHEVRRSTPEQSHRDAVRLARRQFRPPNFVCGFERAAA